ncbi:enoyl-CoA hydratase/isomerase family protein [Roseivivax sp. CAU 1761]
MIRVDEADGLRRVTLDRADKANALTAEMLEGLCAAVEGAGAARGLILTGAGGVFSAGADLDAARAGLTVSPLWERLSAAIAGFPGISVAALNGTAAGGALGMVLACDLRLAVPGAKFFYPVMKLGFLPQPSDAVRLAALVGPARAKMILMAGAKVAAEEALCWGLVDRIVAPGDLAGEAEALTRDARAAAPDHARAIRALIP